MWLRRRPPARVCSYGFACWIRATDRVRRHLLFSGKEILGWRGNQYKQRREHEHKVKPAQVFYVEKVSYAPPLDLYVQYREYSHAEWHKPNWIMLLTIFLENTEPLGVIPCSATRPKWQIPLAASWCLNTAEYSPHKHQCDKCNRYYPDMASIWLISGSIFLTVIVLVSHVVANVNMPAMTESNRYRFPTMKSIPVTGKRAQRQSTKPQGNQGS